MVDISLTLVLQWINFLILVYFLNRFLVRPLLAVLDARRQQMRSQLEQIEEKQQQADSLCAKAKQQLQDSYEEAFAIRKKAEDSAFQQQEDIVKDAHLRAEKIIAQGVQQVEQKEKQMWERLRKRVIHLSADIASVVLSREIKPQDHENAVEEFLRQEQ